MNGGNVEDMRTVGDDEADALQQAYLQGVLEGERSAGARVGIAPTARRRLFRPRTRRRWFPPLITGIASIGMTLALVNFLHINSAGVGQPVDNHPTVSQIVNGYGQPIPVPAPSVADSSSKTTKSPAATSEDVTTGQSDEVGDEASGDARAQGVAQDGRKSTSSGAKGSAAGDDSSANRSTSGSKSSGTTSGSSKGSGSKPASTTPAGKGGGGSVPATPPADSDPTPAPTQDVGPVSTLLGGVGTVVGDLGDTVGGTLNGVGGLLGGGQSDEG